MTVIEKTLKLLDLKVYEYFYIKGMRDLEGNSVEYCVDYQGHLLYRDPKSKRLYNSRAYTLINLLNGSCSFNQIEKEDPEKEHTNGE